MDAVRSDRISSVTSRPPRPLGVGFPYIATLPPELYRSGLLDFVELTPETLCRELRRNGETQLAIAREHLDRAQETCAGLETVVHGVELSIGSAHGWNSAYVSMLDSLHAVWPFQWHSEHLGFQTFAGAGGASIEVGLPLPLPCTTEAADVVAPRAAALQTRYGVPFLLENPAHYFADLPADAGIGDEVGLMNAIVRRAGCWQLLDLHNLYCNGLNLGVPVREMLDRVALDRVVEIHVAGGSWRDGFYMDGHDAAVPEPVWSLLEDVLPRCENVAGLVFEVLDEVAPAVGADLVARDLEHARRIWNRRGLRREEKSTCESI